MNPEKPENNFGRKRHNENLLKNKSKGLYNCKIISTFAPANKNY